MAKLKLSTRRLLVIARKGAWGSKGSSLRNAVAKEIRQNKRTSLQNRLGDLYYSKKRNKRI